MRCPFLKDAQVRYCGASEVRKLIPGGTAAVQRCAAPAHAACPQFRARSGASLPADAGCPFLEQPLVQYCGAAAVPKFIPYSDAPQARCGNSRFRFCDLYLALAQAGAAPPAAEMVEGLYYSANHMWLDLGEDGWCQVGVDALLARVLGAVERVSFLPSPGVHRPAAVLAAHGTDLQVVFPNPLLVTATNVHLRADPAPVAADPYGRGWLFEGRAAGSDPAANLLRGTQAQAWMRAESERLTAFVHEEVALAAPADGGVCAPGVVEHLGREGALRLFHRFFSPLASW